ncbi:MAG: GNAT family N-acetyltransferase [Planctomycetes bacterium]|nr:GNAT family N-acetyltransferase [Planctomycetota bacterium]
MPRRKISVLILYNSPRTSGGQAFIESEAGVLAEVEAVGKALDKLRIPHRVVGVREFEELPAVLSASDEPVVFNLVEGFWTNPDRQTLVPAIVRSFGKGCTGNDTPGLLLSLDKWQSKTLLAAAGIPTPKGLIVPVGETIPMRDLFEGPYIVKPIQTDASEGIDKTSIVQSPGKALRQVVQRIHDQLAQPALIEQYIEGREFNISVLHRRGEAQVLPLAEIDFSAFEPGRPRIVGYEAKWLEDTFEYQHTPRIIPAPLPQRVAARVRELAAASCRALSCFDYCRVDFRLDKTNRPYVLEVNANPDISPDAGLAAAIKAAGISYPTFVKLTIDNAVAGVRKTEDRGQTHPASVVRPPSSEIAIRWCQPEDRQVVLSFLAETGFFRPDEIDIARELIDSAIAEGPKGHYQSFVACVNAETVGWICWGPTPCTLGTYDIYWIGVSPAWQGRGIGRALTNFAEQAIAERGGRLFVVETSSREAYIPTRRFYEALGYWEAGRIPDFYGPGDDKVIFLKAASDATHLNK